MQKDQFAGAQRELETYFASAEAILGLHGSGFEGSSSLVWDARRCNDLHESMLRRSFGANFCRCRALRRHCGHGALRDLADISPTIALLPRAHWVTAFVTFTSARRWPDYVRSALQGSSGASLVGLAVTGKPLRERYARRFKREPETTMVLLDFAEHEAKPDASGPGRVRSFFAPVRQDAERRLERALVAYDALMRERRQALVEAARYEAAS